MPNNANRNHRNQRNNPYTFDDMFVTVHRSAAGVAWRWRTELAIIGAIAAAVWRLSMLITLAWAGVVVGLVLAVLACLPWTRRFITRRFWCVLARHRVHRLCWETRMHTRAGRLPLVLWVRPTKVGERLHILCRAGICAEDFEAHIGELRAACFAREARVARNRRWSQLVTVDIIRRDTLSRDHQVTTPLHAHKGKATTRPQPNPGWLPPGSPSPN
jgi:hypothetical protein